MKFALTYDLKSEYAALGYSSEEIAEFDCPETIDGIEAALRSLGHEVERVGNIFALVERLAAGWRADCVFNIAEGMHGYAREAQVPALLEAYRIPCTFADAATLSLCLRKDLTKLVVRDAGLETACFAVIGSLADAEKLDLPFPVFLKPVAEGTGKGVSARSLVADRDELLASVSWMLEHYRQLILAEEYLPGREYTVGIVGSGADARVVGGMEVHFNEGSGTVYSYENKAQYEEKVRYSRIDAFTHADVFALALDSWRALGCRDGGRIDIRRNAKDEPSFIEVNPLAGLNPVDSDLPIICRMNGISYETLIGWIVESALKRCV